jgi:hypothetical protein
MCLNVCCNGDIYSPLHLKNLLLFNVSGNMISLLSNLTSRSILVVSYFSRIPQVNIDFLARWLVWNFGIFHYIHRAVNKARALCFFLLVVSKFVFFQIFTCVIMLTQLFSSGSVNIGGYFHRPASVNIHQHSLRPWRIIVKSSVTSKITKPLLY